ncbi:MAG: hypothetical protein NTAFB05_20950 [Nitrobacter sp.]|uniref:hypothetical protein n=1 Tax=Nitrobacter sp. TaxID=29420 RepID=UPI00387DDFD8
MNIFFKTHTKGDFNRKTRIARRIDSSEIEIIVFEGTELEGILAFALGIIRDAAEQSTLIFHSKRNTFRDAFEKGWIEAWARDGFAKRPPEHRETWAQLYALLQERDITIKAAHLPEQEERALTDVLRGKRRETWAPGEPVENPWEDRSSELNDAIDRAVKRKR